MKTNIIYVLIAAFVALVLSSCSVSKNSLSVENPVSISTKNEAVNKNCYVVNKDGSITYYKSLKLITAMFATPYLLADGKIKINQDNIKAYKDSKHYAIAQEAFYNEVKGKVATDVLPGFAIKEMSGQINIYSLQYYAVGKVYKKYFLQSGEDGKIQQYSPQLLREMVSVDGLLVNRVNFEKINSKPKKIFSIVESFNQSEIVTKN